MNTKIILFLVLISCIYFGLHFLVYISLTKFFTVANSTVKTTLLIIIMLLGFSFIVSSVLVHFNENIFTKMFYIGSGAWLGILMNLVLAFLALWIIVFFFRLIGFTYAFSNLAAIMIIASLLLSFYGVANAHNPQITEIDVNIKNLPQQWNNKKIVQISDAHLGMVHSESFATRVSSLVNSLNPDLILITGDLLDGMDGNVNPVLESLRGLKADQGVYFSTGNHETYFGKDKALNFIKMAKINILENQAVDIDGLQIAGIGYSNNSEIKDYDKNKPTILMNHTPTSIFPEHSNMGEQQISSYVKPDLDFSKAKNMGVDLQLSGHTHAGQLMPFNWLTKLIFKGYDYGLHEDGDFSIYTSSGVGTWGPPMRTGTKSEIVLINLHIK